MARRYFQFGLRSLLLAVTAIAVWLGIVSHQAIKQREAVAALRERGWVIEYDYEVHPLIFRSPQWLRRLVGVDYFANVARADFVEPNRWPGRGRLNIDGDMAYIESFTHIKSIRFSNVSLSSLSLSRLGHLTELETLGLYDSAIKGQVFPHLAKMRSLKSFYLCDCTLRDERLSRMPALPNLRELYLTRLSVKRDDLPVALQLPSLIKLHINDVNLDDRAVMSLCKLPELRHLRLARCPITNEALRSLSQIKQLRELDLAFDYISGEELSRLRNLADLEELDLIHSNVNDDDLPNLDALPNLKKLDLVGTWVTPEGGLAFQKAHPNVLVDWPETEYWWERFFR